MSTWKANFAVSAAVGILSYGTIARAEVVIESVTIRNSNNAAELSGEGAGGLGPDRNCGTVDHVYNIGTFEVTAGQYRDFLNAVDPTGSNTYGLYNNSMDNSAFGCQITWNGSTYDFSGGTVEAPGSTAADWENRPVNFVSWGDAARFCNWLHNGQPAGRLTGDPAQDAGLTEDGSYYLNGAMANEQLMAVVRRSDATWVVPSEDEWYKAAYHYNDGVTGNYYEYPTCSDNAPVSEPCPGGSSSANYDDGGYVVGPPFYRNEVGCYVDSGSCYGTFDQGGNVSEWNEGALYGFARGLRGGSFSLEFIDGVTLRAADRSGHLPGYEDDIIGFRVAEVWRTEIEWVTVCNPGNVDAYGAGRGGVDYIYRISKYEVTNGQYCEFLNAVAANDANELYNTDMGGGFGGITQAGSPGSYAYSVISGRANMPVNYVTWYDTLRFANWMHNGQPTGVQDVSTTEDGAYDMSLGPDVVRRCDARVFLPGGDEWYKAAYHYNDGATGNYWDYPTQSDTAPTCEAPPGTDLVNGSANCGDVVGDTTPVGAYTAKPSVSAYGTFDQCGNVREWMEVPSFPALPDARDVGGCFRRMRDGHSRDVPMPDIGFRVAATCQFTDADGDGDIDLDDFRVFQTCFCGPSE